MEDLQTRAINRLNEEISKNLEDTYIATVGEFLIDYVQKHQEAAEKFLDVSKCIAGSLTKCTEFARPKTYGDVAVVRSDVVFKLVLEYYGLSGIASSDLLSERAPKTKASLNVSLEDLL